MGNCPSERMRVLQGQKLVCCLMSNRTVGLRHARGKGIARLATSGYSTCSLVHSARGSSLSSRAQPPQSPKLRPRIYDCRQPSALKDRTSTRTTHRPLSQSALPVATWSTTAAGSSSVSFSKNEGSPSSPSAVFATSVSGIAPGWTTTDVISGYSAAICD
jgi:hypothetical protein